MKRLEQTYRTAIAEIYGNLEGIRTDRGTDTWDLFNSEDRRYDDRNGGQVRNERVQTDTEGNDEYLLSGNRGTSNGRTGLKYSNRDKVAMAATAETEREGFTKGKRDC